MAETGVERLIVGGPRDGEVMLTPEHLHTLSVDRGNGVRDRYLLEGWYGYGVPHGKAVVQLWVHFGDDRPESRAKVHAHLNAILFLTLLRWRWKR